MIKDPILSAVSDMAFPAIPDYNTSLALAMEFQLEQTQWLSEKEIELRQLQQLKLVLNSARKNSPYYRKVLPSNLPMDDLQVLIDSLPILSRLELQRSNNDMHSHFDNGFHKCIDMVKTSGTTGTAVKIGKSRINDFLWNAFAFRDHYWHERDFSGETCLILWAEQHRNRAPEGVTSKNWGKITQGIYKTGKSHRLNVISTLEEQANWLQKKNPTYIASLPSNLKALAKYCIAENIDFKRLKAVRTVGETVKPELREIVREAWGVKITDAYTCEEVGYIAIQCPEHEHYHVQSENIIVEILDDNNKPCQVGKPGRLLITAINNFATPLIRYELGDYAEWGEPCSCGRGLPVIKTIYGRERNRLKLPDGTSVFPYFGDHYDIARIIGYAPRQYQIIQETLNDITIRFAIDEPLSQAQEDEISTGLKGTLGDHFQFKFDYPKHIAKGSRGKYDEFICKIE